ncbi:hypothetical protein E4P39_04680 [Blastococcus sp. CT_GayMR19]|uniref:hypothetical protein n=1 Tax=Blastococcus sp. CT_GayMR19 TaxID=2559608 RepID=UPI0010748BDB|nr:hypothetical protein [Blastococcus sp. CT_GayMR19]TFV78489.1 hypothetical protein E4P39_04680 [Blastococcus sp. CT_GayMR19]
MRRLLLIVATLIAPMLTSACSVPGAAVAGVGVDKLGRLVGYLRVCHDSIHGATIYHDENDDLGSWTASDPVTQFAKWSLADPPSDWEAAPPLGELQPGIDYTLYGWTSDNSWSANSVTFTLAELATVEPGRVVYWAGDNDASGDVNVVVSEVDFNRDACEMVS